MEDDAAAGFDEGVAPVSPPSGPFRRLARGDGPTPAAICPFLAAESDRSELGPPVALADHANRCIALGEPVPQSSRQQELVCLTGSHVNCPRFLRGTLMGAPAPAPPAREPISPAVIGAALVLAAALAASFGFLVVRGGFDVALVSPDPSGLVAVASPSVPVVAGPSPSPTISPVPPSAAPSPSPSAVPSPLPSPSPTIVPATPAPATPAPTPRPTSDRFALLTRCPSTPDCWIYVIRSGDNLRSIANWFGVSYERVLAMNPSIRDPATVRPGFRLRIPTPTR